MLEKTINFANLLLAALVVGTMFGIWLGFNPADLSAGAYVEQQQQAIRALKVAMPVLGAITTMLTLASAFFSRGNRQRMFMLLAAFVCLVIVGLVTRFLNQPINAVVITWTASSPPSNWIEIRDEWWKWHVARTAIGVVGLCLLIAANMVRNGNEKAGS